jgi:uncharacterized membrane protein YcaP (DUF421 family)
VALESSVVESIFGGMKDLTLGQECARAVLIFFYGLVMLRLSGRRTFAQMSAIDLVISIIVGSNLSRAMTGGVPFWGTLASVAVLVALHLLLAHGVARSSVLARWVEGKPAILARDGKIMEPERLRCKISMADLEESLREQGLDGLADIGQTRKLVLEPSGKISVIRKRPHGET